MHDQLQAHLATHRGLAKDGADIEQTDAAHLQQVLQQLGAAALDGGLVDAIQVDRVIGHQTVAARDQLQAQLALAQTRFAGDQHAQAQNVHEHAVHGGALGKMLGQVGAQHVDDKGRRFAGGEHGDLSPLAHGHQGLGCDLAVGQHQHRRLQGDDARDTARAIVCGGVGEVGDLALAQDLHPVGVDVIEVAHQIGARARGAHGHFVETPLGGAQSGQPFPLELCAMVLEQDVGADDGGFHGRGAGRLKPAGRTASPRSGHADRGRWGWTSCAHAAARR